MSDMFDKNIKKDEEKKRIVRIYDYGLYVMVTMALTAIFFIWKYCG